VRPCIQLDGAFVHFLESEFDGFAVFSLQHHLPHLRKYIRDLGRLEGPLPRHEQAFVAEENPLRIRVAGRLDIHRSIAGDETLAAGLDTTEAMPRHNVPLEAFRQRHRRNPYLGWQVGFPARQRLGREPVFPRAAKIIHGPVLLPRPCPLT
jgi:hypothetical protein